MKRIIAFLLVVVLCLPIFASCTLIKIEKPGETSETEEIVYDIDSAKAYLKNLYKDRATTTPADFEVVSKILIGGVSYDVTWTVDTDLITVEAGETWNVTTSGDGDHKLWYYDENQSQFRTKDSGTPENDTYTFSNAGTYYIGVGYYSSSKTGDFYVTITKQ